MEIGLGQLGLSPDEFWQTTPFEFLCMQKGFFELETMRHKQDWGRTIALLNIQLPAGQKISLDSIFKERKPIKVMTREEVEALDKKWSGYVNRNNEPALPGRHGKL